MREERDEGERTEDGRGAEEEGEGGKGEEGWKEGRGRREGRKGEEGDFHPPGPFLHFNGGISIFQFSLCCLQIFLDSLPIHHSIQIATKQSLHEDTLT